MPEYSAYENIARQVLEWVARSVAVAGDLIVDIKFIESAPNKIELQVRCQTE